MEDDEDGLRFCTTRLDFATLSGLDAWKVIGCDRGSAVPTVVLKIEDRCRIGSMPEPTVPGIASF